MNGTSVKKILESLGVEYETLLETKSKMESEINRVKEYLDHQITAIQALNTEFEDKNKEYRVKLTDSDRKQNTDCFVHNLSQEKRENSEDLIDWRIYNLGDKMSKRMKITPLVDFIDIKPIRQVKFSHSGDYIAFCTPSAIRVYDRKASTFVLQHLIPREEHTNEYTTICWSPNDQSLLVGSKHHSIKIFNFGNLNSPTIISAGQSSVTQLAVASNSVFFAAAMSDSSIIVYDFASTDKICSLTQEDGKKATCLSINSSSTAIAVGYVDGCVTFLDVAQASFTAEAKCHDVAVCAVAFVGDERIVTGSLDTTVRIWNIGSDRALEPWRELQCHSNYVLAVAVDAGCHWLATASKDGTAKLTYLKTGEVCFSLEGHANSVVSVDIADNESAVITAGGDNCAKLWQLKYVN